MNILIKISGPGPVLNVKYVNRTDNMEPASVELSWNQPAEKDKNGAIIGYDVHYKLRTADSYNCPSSSSCPVVVGENTKPNLILKNLSKLNVYKNFLVSNHLDERHCGLMRSAPFLVHPLLGIPFLEKCLFPISAALFVLDYYHKL